ncbi:MAG: hypothetical protein DLM73_04065 [Chthoniobacterales bacterium]|nr:MAG: hypothetical protein DLM73_04065 [Chthoniobacterales bacterium]
MPAAGELVRISRRDFYVVDQIGDGTQAELEHKAGAMISSVRAVASFMFPIHLGRNRTHELAALLAESGHPGCMVTLWHEGLAGPAGSLRGRGIDRAHIFQGGLFPR